MNPWPCRLFYLMQVGSVEDADYVLYLWTAPLTPTPPTNGSDIGEHMYAAQEGSPLGKVSPSKLVCLDFSDQWELSAGLSR